MSYWGYNDWCCKVPASHRHHPFCSAGGWPCPIKCHDWPLTEFTFEQPRLPARSRWRR